MNLLPKIKTLLLPAFTIYIISLALSYLSTQKLLPFLWIFTGILSVSLFFSYSVKNYGNWIKLSDAQFIKKLFWTSLTIRTIYVVASYAFYDYQNGNPFEFGAADSQGYHNEALWLINLLKSGDLDRYLLYIKGNYSDLGYVAWLSIVYSIFGENIIIARILKALLSAYTVVFVFKLANRNFGSGVGKLAGIFALLSPNLIYYCGLHLKETEMVFLVVFFIERADYFIKESTLRISTIIQLCSVGLTVFLFRTVLGAAALVSFLSAFFLITNKKNSGIKKLTFSVVLITLFWVFKGGNLESEIGQYWGNKDSNQAKSMQARSSKGNSLTTYGSTALFAPFMLLVPFPTLTNIETQQNQMMLNGGYFVKSFLAFFVFIAFLNFYNSQQLTKYSLLLLYFLSYLAILAMSKFAISERFHLPLLPIFYIFAAEGIYVISKKQHKLFKIFCFLLVCIIVAWNLFKIEGR
jgi:hypothetical protein